MTSGKSISMETGILNYRKNSKDEYSVKIGSIFCEEIRQMR